MGKAKKWTLLANYYDPTLIRSKFCLDLAEKLGLEATPGHHRVEVWIDGSYSGMYLLIEKIEADDNKVNIKTKNGDFLIEMDTSLRKEKEIFTRTLFFENSSLTVTLNGNAATREHISG